MRIIRNRKNNFAALARFGQDVHFAAVEVNYVLHKPSVADLHAIETANRDTLAVMPLVIEGRIDKAMQALHT